MPYISPILIACRQGDGPGECTHSQVLDVTGFPTPSRNTVIRLSGKGSRGRRVRHAGHCPHAQTSQSLGPPRSPVKPGKATLRPPWQGPSIPVWALVRETSLKIVLRPSTLSRDDNARAGPARNLSRFPRLRSPTPNRGGRDSNPRLSTLIELVQNGTEPFPTNVLPM